MNINNFLALLADHSPSYIFFLALATIATGRLTEYFLKAKKMHLDSNAETVSAIFKKLNEIQGRCDELEGELEVWREKYYSLKKDLELLEIENEKLINKIKNESKL